MALAEEVRVAVEPPVITSADIPLAVDCTIGIASFPKDGGDAETLLRHAGIATYTAKEWHLAVLGYSPTVDPHDAEQLELVGSLRDAADNGELRLCYQPQVDLATNEIAGFEALTFWAIRPAGCFPPSLFIPIAERTGAIRHVTRAVLSGAVEQLAEWRAINPNCSRLRSI